MKMKCGDCEGSRVVESVIGFMEKCSYCKGKKYIETYIDEHGVEIIGEQDISDKNFMKNLEAL